MSLTAIKPWFQKRMSALEFKEHTDGFNTANISELDLDRTWHFRITNVKGDPVNQSDQRTESETTIQFFLKGGREAYSTIDTAIIEIENCIKECCNITNRTSDGLLNVVFSGAEIEPRAEADDNSVLVTLTFLVTVLLCLET